MFDFKVGKKNIWLRMIIIVLVFTIFISNSFGTSFQMEWNSVISNNENWIKIPLINSYVTPVIVATPEYTSTNQDYGISTWITNVTSNSFMLRTSNEHLNNTQNITVHYIVIEKGSWVLPGNNIKVEAGIHNTSKVGSSTTGWTCPDYGDIINFSITFDNNPLLISTRGSNNNPNSWAVTFQNDPNSQTATVTTTQMCQGLSQSKATSPGNISSNESIYWIAIDEGNGYLNDIEFEILWNLKDTGDSGGSWINGYKDGIPFVESWSHSWINPPKIIVTSQTSVGGSDGSWPVLYDTGDKSQIRMFVDEANERSHAGSESGGGWAFSNSGSFGIHEPNNIFINFSKSLIFRNKYNNISSIITDFEGNNTINTVISTIKTPNSTLFNISLSPEILIKNLTTSDFENSTKNYTAISDGEIIGESGHIYLYNRTSKLIEFKLNYSQKPVVIATVVTQNNDESPFIPTFYSINNTHANITLCRDNGATTCDNNYDAERVDYVILDINKTNNYSWIEVGTVNASTDGSKTSINFKKTFANTPYIFSTVQSYNINSVVTNGISGTSWISGISTTGADLLGCDHPGTANSCGGTSTEEYAYLAIDLNNENLKDFTSGTKSIRDSSWTSISFGREYNKPLVFVTVNSDNGNQDPKYPWVKSVTSKDSQIRYCEADGANYCDTHTGEDTMWFAIEEGFVGVGNGGDDIEKNLTIKTYSNVFRDTTHNITSMEIKLNITKYNNSGSVSRSNSNPDLEIQMMDDTFNWITIGDLNINSIGIKTINVTNSSILKAWSNSLFRNLRIKGINFDYYSSTNIDYIFWNFTQIKLNYNQYSSYWFGNFSKTSLCGNYTLTDLFSKDYDNLINHTIYSNIYFNVPCGPLIRLNYPINNTKLLTNKTVEFNWYIDSSDSNLTCSIYINSKLNQSFTCFSGVNNSLNISINSGHYNWTINATDSYNISNKLEEEWFYNILNYHSSIHKKIFSINNNLYQININISNYNNYTTPITIIDYNNYFFNSGSFSINYNWSNSSNGPKYYGNILGWNLNILNYFNINYSITNNQNNYYLVNEFLIGLE